MVKSLTIPPHVSDIMQQVLDAGHEIFLVGGVVRDFLMGKQTSDYDFATSAKPGEIKEIFADYHILDYGQEHGTIAIHSNGFLYEITTYRIEADYSDGRRPDRVEFVNDLKLDLDRRDFTINALAADINGDLIDYHGGVQDFHNQTIQCVGDPVKRFEEDSLRVLRAVRFALRFDFTIEENTLLAIQECAPLLRTHKISGERIQSELSEILMYTQKCFDRLFDTGILQVLFPVITDTTIEPLLAVSHQLDETELNSWSLLLYVLREAGQDLSDIFANIPGYGKFKEELFLESSAVLSKITNLTYQLQKADLLRVIYPSYRYLEKYPEFIFRDLLTAVFSILEHLRPEIHSYSQESTTNFLQSRIPVELPVDGHFVRSKGYVGPQIGAVLRILEIVSLFHPIKTEDDVENVLNIVISPVDLQSLLELVSIDGILRTILERDEILNMISHISRINETLAFICRSQYHEEILQALEKEEGMEVDRIIVYPRNFTPSQQMIDNPNFTIREI